LARRNATHCFIGGPKRHIQPERYAQLPLTTLVKNYKIIWHVDENGGKLYEKMED
jgi:hypothetical protein